jgi:hypothetical protein
MKPRTERADERPPIADPPPDPAAEPDPEGDLDLDLEEIGDGDRLKEGFTGQER